MRNSNKLYGVNGRDKPSHGKSVDDNALAEGPVVR